MGGDEGEVELQPFPPVIGPEAAFDLALRVMQQDGEPSIRIFARDRDLVMRVERLEHGGAMAGVVNVGQDWFHGAHPAAWAGVGQGVRWTRGALDKGRSGWHMIRDVPLCPGSTHAPHRRRFAARCPP